MSSDNASLQEDSHVSFKTIKIKKLHPTFGAEVTGVEDFENMDEEQFGEIKAAMAKVSNYLTRQTEVDKLSSSSSSIPTYTLQ